MRQFRNLRWRRVLPVTLAGGVLAIGSAMALGREGPPVQMGGSIGTSVAEWLQSPTQERLILAVAGAGVVLAAAFNAPLPGVVFVREELQRDFRPAVFGSAFIAAAPTPPYSVARTVLVEQIRSSHPCRYGASRRTSARM